MTVSSSGFSLSVRMPEEALLSIAKVCVHACVWCVPVLCVLCVPVLCVLCVHACVCVVCIHVCGVHACVCIV